jgi:hypothetical protein
MRIWKTLPPRRRKDVSLFVVVKCAEGFAICADSQETVNEVRVSVQKIIPRKCGNFQLAVGGVGDLGELVDSFVRQLEANVSDSSLSTLKELEKFCNKELSDFRKAEAAIYPRRILRRMEFVIAATALPEKAVQVWRTAASRLIPVEDNALIGWQPELYKQIAGRLYRPNMPLVQGIFFGLHLLTLADDTSTFVGSPFTVIIARENGLWLDKKHNINNMLSRLSVFSEQFDEVMLAFPDISLNDALFREKLAQFERDILELRESYFKATMRAMAAEGFATCNDPYARIPLGTTFGS